jgi:hypothetical protein
MLGWAAPFLGSPWFMIVRFMGRQSHYAIGVVRFGILACGDDRRKGPGIETSLASVTLAFLHPARCDEQLDKLALSS